MNAFSEADSDRFLPSAHFHFLTPIYEAIVYPFFRAPWAVIAKEAARLAPLDGRVIDLGCGPGSVLRRLSAHRPDLELVGVDIDDQMLSIARRKIRSPRVTFQQAPIDRLPFDDGQASLVLSSFVFHHLHSVQKRRSLHEIRRVLAPAGSLLLCDFSVPTNRISDRVMKLIGRFEPDVLAQLDGELQILSRECGACEGTMTTFYGCIRLHRITFDDELPRGVRGHDAQLAFPG